MKSAWHFFFAGALFCSLAEAQVRPLTHADYDGWHRLEARVLSPNGHYAAAVVTPQVGDGRTEIISVTTGKKWILFRANAVEFNSESTYALVRIPHPAASIRKLKVDKVKSEDFPKPKYALVHLASGKVDTLGRASSCNMSLKASGYVAWLDSPYNPKKKESKKTEYARLIVRSLDGKNQDTLSRVKEFAWARESNTLAAWQTKPGKKGSAKVFRWTPAGFVQIGHGMAEVAQLGIHPKGTHIAWVHTTDSSKAVMKKYKLSGWTGGKSSVWLEAGFPKLPPLHEPSPFEPLHFTTNGKWLLMGYRPVQKTLAKDTLLDEEKARLDVWAWHDDQIQPMQSVRKKDEEKRTFKARISMATLSFLPLGNVQYQDVRVAPNQTHDWAVRLNYKPYQWQSTFKAPYAVDAEAIHLASGRSVPLGKGLLESPKMSPSGRYAYAFLPEEGHYIVWNVKDSTSKRVSVGTRYSWVDEEHDMPQVAPAYGVAGWTRKDSLLVVYDAFDLWALDPTGQSKPYCLSQGRGRDSKTRWRVLLERTEQRYLEETPWMIQIFHEPTKRSGYARWDYKTGHMDTLMYGDFNVDHWETAEEGAASLFSTSTVSEYPDLRLVKEDGSITKAVTEANPQQKNFIWPVVRLIEYKALGQNLQGLLYTPPAELNTPQGIPVLVYFYEKNADDLHGYRSPAPSASTINIPYFVSRGYAVFVPDIVYEIGKPGQSALQCINAGVDAALREDKRLDPKRMALQGQSWGGYQTAFLITQTQRYVCAMAGAPVSNMTSAYGGIRYGSGMSRQFQYEQTQSRLGKTLWEDRELYIDNSPVFFANQVQTPLLIMHNDADGAVPYTQSIEFYMALRRLQKPVWMLVYNGEDHNLTKRPNKVDLSIRMAEFFDHYLMGAPAPVWMTEGVSALDKKK